MHVFLTGATGFIGSHVARRLVREDCRVTALVRSGSDPSRIADVLPHLELVEGDLTAPEALEPRLNADPPEVCLHLAWFAEPGRYLNAPENLDCVAGSLALLRVLDRAGCRRVVMAGTCFEYDASTTLLSEESPIRPRSLYAASKHALFLIAEQFERVQGRSLAWARIFYQYGPWEDSRRLVPVVIRKLLAGEPCPLSPGGQVRDFLHIEDVAAALCAIARSDVEGAVNIGSSQPVSIAEIAREIGRLTGREDLLQFGAFPDRPGEPPFIAADTRRLRAATGWSPRYSLREGLADTIRWWRQDTPAADQ